MVELEAGGEHRSWVLLDAVPEELDAVLSLLAAAGLPAGDVEKQFGEAYVLAVRDGRLVGTAGLEVHGEFGFLRSVAVAASVRGGGLGQALVNDRLLRARTLGLEAVYLLTMDAMVWFERFGFRAVDRSAAPATLLQSSQFTTSCPSTAVLMKYTP